MATNTKVGRNDRCPCGSGKKFKNCCERKGRRLTFAGWATIGAMLAAAAVVIYFVVFAAESDRPFGRGVCPPGQVWDPQHGHCH